jgi:hypothetical protein
MRTVWIRISLVTSLGCALLLASLAAHAQRFGATEQAAYMAGLRVDRSMLVAPLASAPGSAMPEDADERPSQAAPSEVNLIGSKSGGVMLEMARVGPEGQFVRPRLLIGRHSPELRSWMSSIGLTAERCMLPQFRGRLKRVPETGKLGAAVLVSARCTFY